MINTIKKIITLEVIGLVFVFMASTAFAVLTLSSTNITSDGALAISFTAPTASGTGMAFTVGAGSTAFDWSITINTANTQDTFILTLPAATNAWTCFAQTLSPASPNPLIMIDRTTTTVTFQQFGITTGTPIFWNNNSVVVGTCTSH